MANYVECNGCKAQVSRVVDGEIEVKAYVKCSDCFIKEAQLRRDTHLALQQERKERVWAKVKFGFIAGVFLGLGYLVAELFRR